MDSSIRNGGYRYGDAEHTEAHSYLLPAVRRILDRLTPTSDRRRVFELGCGNGAAAAFLQSLGYEVVGVDPSEEGIAQARAAYPGLRLESGSCYDDLAAKYGRFPIVLSLEVVEHVFLPRVFAKAVHGLLEPGGIAIVSTPFHGYWKNLALALTGRLDDHFTALWDYGHIKFWSRRTLALLFEEAGLAVVDCVRVGRIAPFAKSMILVARRDVRGR
jgi:SAM-dependent methyltransferase